MILDKLQYKTKKGESIVVPVFNGKDIDNMPVLVAQGYRPISVAELMEQRINAWDSNDAHLAEHWGNNYFDSGDSIIHHPDGRIKVVTNSQTIRSINNNTPLKWNGSLVLENGTFDKVQGVEFTKKQIDKFANQNLKKEEAVENPIWLALAQDDKALLKEYVKQVYSRINNSLTMRVWISRESQKFEAERIWCFTGLDEKSGVYSYDDSNILESDKGRLVGVPLKIQVCNKVTQVSTKIDLEALLKDFKSLDDEGFLTPKVQELYRALQTGKYNF